MSENGRVSEPELAPHRPLGSVVAVWIGTVLAGAAVVLAVPAADQATWLAVTLAAAVVAGFAVQLRYGGAPRFLARMALTSIGALVLLGAISAAAALADLLAAI